MSCILVLCTRVHRYFSASTHVYINQADADLPFVQQRKKVGYLRRQEISIEDIARAAGVSHSTVSRALRDNPLISADVRERIQQLAHEMGYTPNAIAHNDPDQEMTIIETFHRRRVDGVLVAASRITSNYRERLNRIRVPTVLINSQAESEGNLLHWVSVDDPAGAQLAVEHLLQLGHRSIGYLGTGTRPRSNRQRLLGYQSALAAAGVSYRDAWAVITPGDEASLEEDVAAGQTSLPRLLDSGITAVFCYNDMIAIGVLIACRERGIAVPQELSVIGFDDIKMTSYVTPPLTTIHQPKVELGRLAAQVMLDLLHNRPGRNYTLPPTLIERASTAPLARD